MASYNPEHLIQKFIYQHHNHFLKFLSHELDLDPLYDREALEEAAEEIKGCI